MIDQVVGNFQIVRELGRGGMGAVYEGVDLMLKRRVAIKIVHPELGRDPVFSERFQKEAMALARLNHPNVTSVYSFSREGEQLILAMELVEGEPLDTWLRTWGALAWQDAGRLAAAALDGLDHAHQNGIIHRDVKPSNLLLTAAGQGIKIMDFGIAHILGERRLTRMGSVVGTIEYMSPEQVAGSELDARTDLYSMGVVLYEMLTGRVPFSGGSDFELMRAQMESVPQSPAELANDVPEWLEGIILRALAKAPDDRYQSATAFAGEIRRGLVDSGEAATATDAAVSAAVVAPAQSPPAGRPAV